MRSTGSGSASPRSRGTERCSSASSPRSRWLSSGGSSAALTVRTYPSILLSIALASCALALACASGCAVKTVFVRDGSPVRVSKARGTVLVLLDGQWTETQPADLPEGWYLVHPSFIEDANADH